MNKKLDGRYRLFTCLAYNMRHVALYGLSDNEANYYVSAVLIVQLIVAVSL